MMDDTSAWLGMLFRSGEVFEVRTKGEQDVGVGWRGWMTYPQDVDKFVDNVIPVSTRNRRNVWVGVCPRTERGSSVPDLARVVWVDCDNIGYDEVMVSITTDLRLPDPTMVVNSGNGIHVYWALEGDVPAEDIRPVTRWLSQNVAGADGVAHDPTRILRVPGTTNFKSPESLCTVVFYDADNSYALDSFPRHESSVQEHILTPKPIVPLSERELYQISKAWVEGQRHAVALAVAGYLRKNRGFDEVSTGELLSNIHFSRGGVEGDENHYDIANAVRTTFNQSLAVVKGYQGLQELGIELGTSTVAPQLKRQAAKMGLIDFNSDIKEQEFWVDGLIGPGLITMIAAAPKQGKSMVAMQIGHAIANGQRAFDFKTDGVPRPVLYFQGELSRGMVYQRAKAMFAPGTYEDVRMFGMTDKPDKIMDLVANPEPLYDLAEHYDVIIIDPLSIFNANDENSVTSARETLSVFDTLKAQGKAVVLIHHTRKLETKRDGSTVTPSMSDVRGSGAWFAAVDALGILYGIGESGNAEMKFTFRAAPERPPLRLYRMPHGGFTSNRDTYMTVLSSRGLHIDLPTDGMLN